MKIRLSEIIDHFQSVSKDVDEAFNNNYIRKVMPKGQFIAMEGEECKFLPIVKSGTIRIYTTSPNGNEMTLYRINKGESCILTITCLLTNKCFPALAYTEKDTEILLVEASVIKDWINKYEIWRSFAFDYMSNIIFRVLDLLEDSKFNRTEIRLIEFLIEKADENNDLKFTHQMIASEIGTSREVISRILKELELKGLIKLSRGSIKILEPGKLQDKHLLI